MESQVLYRKWRPQTLAEVMGQEHVTRTLKNALERERVAHAYLFCGPRGTGKTSTGRIMAKAVNCLSNGKGEPCNSCTICQAIGEGSALDVIEIDAASNRGIDEIRDLREKANFAPNMARRKVYIVDEVHMLTDAASNALLKTLEEPPPHVIFVLATTETHKLLPTIISRCQRFDFRRLSQSSIISRLSLICASEGILIQPETLALIAKSATGSLRDAVNLLDQIATSYGTDIEISQVQTTLGITGDLRSQDLARHIINDNSIEALKVLHSSIADGVDLRQFHRELLEYLRHLLLVKCGSEASIDATVEDIQDMKAAVSGASLNHVLKTVKLMGQLDLRLDSYSPLPLEVAIVDCALTQEIVTEASPREADSTPLQQKTAPATTQREASKEQPTPVQPAPPRTEKEKPTPTAVPTQTSSSAGSDWEKVLHEIRSVNKKVEALLRSCEPISFENGTAMLRFYYPFHKDKVEEPECRRIIEETLTKVLGSSHRMECVLEPRGKKPQQPTVPQGHIVKAAIQMGAKIVNTEEQYE